MPIPTTAENERPRLEAALRRAELKEVEAQLERLRRERARRSLIAFNHYIDPEYLSPRHVVYVADLLRQCERYIETGGREGIGRLIINMPPRHGKSTTITKRWPAFLLARHLNWRVGLVAYNDEAAADFSRANRAIIRDNERFATLFPGVRLNPESTAVQRWALDGASADNPNLVAVGIDGALTGRGFQAIILDDPIKSRSEAESNAFRTRLISQYTGTVRTRLEPGGVVIVVQTRWHEEDLPGQLVEKAKLGEGETFTVINLPALAEADDPLGRSEGQALWPERYDREALLATRMALGGEQGYDWVSQYQGHPKPPGGTHVNRDDFVVIPSLPERFTGDKPAERLTWFRYWDLAVTSKTDSDFTASVRMAVDNEENIYLADMIRDKWQWPDQKKHMKNTMLSERSLGVRHGVESALHGIAAVQEFMRDPDLRGIILAGVDVESDKLTRALPFFNRAKARKVFLIAGPWVSAFINECAAFTGHNDPHDDQVDTASGGLRLTESDPATRLADYYRRKATELKKKQDKAKEDEPTN